MATLKYHQATFDMLKRTPVFSEAAIAALDAREQELGIRFPASVREWFSIEGVNELLHYYSNDDYLCKIAEIGEKRERYDDEDFDNELEEYYDLSLLPFLHENQAVFEVSFRLNGSDDPSVWIWDDEVWRQVDNHFSHFIYSWIWNFLYYRSPYRVIADGDKPSSADLNILRVHLNEVLPDSNHLHCFEGVGQHLKIDPSYNEEITWWLEAESAEALYDLAKIVVQCDGFATSKFNTFRSQWFSSQSEAILERLRKEYNENNDH